uniref:2-succinyl-6-hydroxy-2, 4-cyclohexadiene-1-carboxylate synthase n=1 Tax=Candidatus Methanophaga sp. ANME-1 ERB7 TaxID=2759913 RepID=A0A7G9Z1W2_9EURY|nr:2-succinyl-6-hydroxy-2,4-cyclohexadiene-1-carboxylate synthase [Methanosarcinales archaeon ANME-1 ERB7]
MELYYEAHGDGEPIIFVHGWMDDCSAWDSQIEFFAKKYNVIAYDHRGHGKSDKPKGGYSIQAIS